MVEQLYALHAQDQFVDEFVNGESNNSVDIDTRLKLKRALRGSAFFLAATVASLSPVVAYAQCNVVDPYNDGPNRCMCPNADGKTYHTASEGPGCPRLDSTPTPTSVAVNSGNQGGNGGGIDLGFPPQFYCFLGGVGVFALIVWAAGRK
jgi:hypothetical protein